MRLVTYRAGGGSRVGVRTSEGIVDAGYADMVDLIRDGQRGLESAAAAAELGEVVEGATLLAPLRPGKILCSGVNYASHAEENPTGTLPEEPFFFSKLPSAVIGPEQAIVIPRASTLTDFEVELAMVIGSRAKRVQQADALGHVFGWTILHDVSARDVQFKDVQITLGKNPDTFAPIGPEIVTADELGDWSTLRVSTTLNGHTMQDAATSEMLFSPARLIEFLTDLITLEPGDVVTTGSPAGVGLLPRPARVPAAGRRGDGGRRPHRRPHQPRRGRLVGRRVVGWPAVPASPRLTLRGYVRAVPATTGLVSSPIPEAETVTTSPGLRKAGGSMKVPQPRGVPVERTSPGRSVMMELSHSIATGGGPICSRTYASWRSSPLT